MGMRYAHSFSGNKLASFPGLLSPNAVEGLVKLIRRMTSGGHLEVWFIAPCMHNTAVYRKCHASRHPPDVILRTIFTRPSTALGDRRPGNEASNKPQIFSYPEPCLFVLLQQSTHISSALNFSSMCMYCADPRCYIPLIY